MAREVVPIAQLERRMAEHGRIRIGEKGAKGQPQKIDVFRFTSHDRSAIEDIAALYGGTVGPWEKQWQVKTEAKEIPVVLPPDPLGGTPIYEFWSKGGVQRRCDGEVCMVPQNGPDGAELVDVPCKCTVEDKLLCKPTTRLTVVLPEIPFGGGWRLESSGWNVAKEMPGMVAVIQEFAVRGFTRATLALEERKDVFAGKTRHYVVPVLRPDVSLEALVAGEGGLKAIAAPLNLDDKAPIAAIETSPEVHDYGAGGHGAAESVVDTSWEDDDIVDAEIVGEGDEPPSSPSPASADNDEAKRETRRREMFAVMKELGMGETERHALALRVSGGRTSSTSDLTYEEISKIVLAIKAVRAGKAELNIDSEGVAQVVTV